MLSGGEQTRVSKLRNILLSTWIDSTAAPVAFVAVVWPSSLVASASPRGQPNHKNECHGRNFESPQGSAARSLRSTFSHIQIASITILSHRIASIASVEFPHGLNAIVIEWVERNRIICAIQSGHFKSPQKIKGPCRRDRPSIAFNCFHRRDHIVFMQTNRIIVNPMRTHRSHSTFVCNDVVLGVAEPKKKRFLI